MNIFKEYIVKNSNVAFYMPDDIANQPDMYADINHLNPKGQRVMTHKLSVFIQEFYKP